MNFYIIGQKIAEARIKTNRTQEDVSEKVGITPAFLSNIETRKKKAKFNYSFKISKRIKFKFRLLNFR